MIVSSVKLFSKLHTAGILKDKSRPIIIADNIRTPENMGLILRLSANIGAINTYFVNDEDKKFKNYKIDRTSSGASTKVNWKIVKVQELFALIPDDYTIVAIETCNNSQNIFSFNFPKKIAFIVGNEVYGISNEVLSKANHKVYIPIPGAISSLNVTHALTVAIFEWLRQIATF